MTAEREHARLAALVTAEQDERRRLSVALHDGPLGALSGVALIQDAALGALRDGRPDEAVRLLENARNRTRLTVQALRDLSAAMEPVILRDASFEAALNALAEQVERAHHVAVELSVADGELLSEKAQVALYQTIREALAQATRRGPARVSVAVIRADDGQFRVRVVDDGVPERRLGSGEAVSERARLLGGRVDFRTGGDGTTVTIEIPSYVATA